MEHIIIAFKVQNSTYVKPKKMYIITRSISLEKQC